MSQERIWVHPAFKKKLKKAAVEQEMSMLELTKRLAREEKKLKNELQKKFSFKI